MLLLPACPAAAAAGWRAAPTGRLAAAVMQHQPKAVAQAGACRHSKQQGKLVTA